MSPVITQEQPPSLFDTMLDALRERQPLFGTAETMAEAMTAAEAAIERALSSMTREAIIMESANVDCRQVRS